ncbi:MAG: hypothetical protein ACT4O0_18005 [Pseudonocardia sp.]
MTELRAEPGVLLAAVAAGAVADLGHPEMLTAGQVVEHLRSAPCCAGDLAAGIAFAGELRLRRTVVHESAEAAIEVLTENYDRYLSLAFALARLAGTAGVARLPYLRADAYIGVPGCPVVWDDAESIWAHPALTRAVAA